MSHSQRMSDGERNRVAAYVRLCAAGAVVSSSYAMCRSPLLPLFAQQLGASPQMIGLVVGASTITGVAVKLPAGAFSDVFGRRALLLAGAAIFATLPFGYLVVTTLGALLLLRFAHGHATAIFGPVSSATFSDLAPPDHRGQWLGTYAAVQGIGQAAGPVAVGYLMANDNFSLPFIVSGCLGMFGLFLTAGWPREQRAARATAWWQRTVEGVREVASDRRILTTSLTQAGQYFVNGAGNAFLPLFAHSVLSTRPSATFAPLSMRAKRWPMKKEREPRSTTSARATSSSPSARTSSSAAGLALQKPSWCASSTSAWMWQRDFSRRKRCTPTCSASPPCERIR